MTSTATCCRSPTRSAGPPPCRSTTCQGRSWRQQLIDAGATRVVLDAAGGTVERRDSKGALRLAVTDALRRPLRAWARDTRQRARPPCAERSSTATTQPKPVSPGRRRPLPTCSAAPTTPTTRLAGSKPPVTTSTATCWKRPAAPSPPRVLMSALPGPAGDWANAFYQADWQPAPGQTLDQHASPLLDTTALHHQHQHMTRSPGPPP